MRLAGMGFIPNLRASFAILRRCLNTNASETLRRIQEKWLLSGGQVGTESEALRSEGVWSAEAEVCREGSSKSWPTSPMQTDSSVGLLVQAKLNSSLGSSRASALRWLGHLSDDVPAMTGIPLPPPRISPLAHPRPLPGPADEQRHPDPRKQSQDVNDPFVAHAHPVFKRRTIQPLMQSAFHAPIVPIHV